MKRVRCESIVLVVALTAVCWATFSSGVAPTSAANAFQQPRNGPGGRGGQGGPGQGGQGPNSPGNRRTAGGAIEDLGQAIFFDHNLSEPSGMACSSCHSPDTGFSSPNSYINDKYGAVPGAIQDRFGSRKPMTISYSWFVPDGPTFWRRRQDAWEGGFFSDGRAQSLEDQARVPMTNVNEMNNVVHGLPNSDLVVRKVLAGSYTRLFTPAFGSEALTKSSSDIFQMICQSLAAFERSRDVSPFSSKYDAFTDGQAQLTPTEMDGLRLFTGSATGRPGGAANYKSAQCVTCHTISDSQNGRRDFFTNWTFANIGVPRNPRNPFYSETKAATNPQGYNADGDHYVDLGLGAILYPERHLPPGNAGKGSDGRGDFLAANGEFRVPSLRNVDKRPSPNFVKCYMHNGAFKSLKEVVHFYNTRNLTDRGEVVDLSASQTAGIKGKPLWPMPEVPSTSTLQNAEGHLNSRSARVGNLGLTDGEEDELVAFLGTLSDGYFTPPRRRPPPN